MTEGYCVKCKKTVEVKDGKEVVNKRGLKMCKGKCPKCGTTVCRILGKA
jgi:hypothetical protein